MTKLAKILSLIATCFIQSVYAANVFYVTPDGTGGGTSWSDATTLAGANGKVAAGDTIRMKAGTYTMTARVQVTKAITIEGGYKAEVDGDLALADNPETVLDGAYNSAVKEPIYLTTSSGTNYFHRLAFTRFYRRGFFKNGAASLEMYNCRFANNSPTLKLEGSTFKDSENKGGGRGALFVGTTGSSYLTLSNCVFEGNCYTISQTANNDYHSWGSGAAVYNFKRVFMDDCVFKTNGYLHTITDTKVRSGKASALFLQAAPITACNTSFIGNFFVLSYSQSTGCVELYGACGGSIFKNCAWIGNRGLRSSNFFTNRDNASNKTFQSAVALFLDSASATVDFENCTIAYNLMGSQNGAAGLTVNTGIANVKNSIIFGNVIFKGALTTITDPDVATTAANGTLNLINTLTTRYALGDAVINGDPSFITPLSGFYDCIKSTVTDPVSSVSPASALYKDGAIDSVMNFDIHLLSADGYFDNSGKYYPKGSTDVSSIAIDAGAIESDYSKEPKPNGGVVNLGCYGNTPEASNSPSGGQPTLAADDVVVTFTEHGQPTITVTPRAADASVKYKASVSIRVTGKVKGSGIIAEETKVFDFAQAGITPGTTVEMRIEEIFDPDSQLTVWVSVAADGAQDVLVEKNISVEGTLPVCYGRGKNGVVHYWADAPGRNDGSSWVNAYRNLADAVSDLNEGATELWIAGTNVLSQSVPRYSATIAEGQILGGFTGMENDASSRAPEAISVIDGNNLYIPLSLANVNRVYIERIKFVRGSPHNIYKVSSVGDLEFRDCQFLDCAKSKENLVGDPEVNKGLGGYFVGNGMSELILSNCVFCGNQLFDTSNSKKYIRGAGAYFANYAQVVMNDCIFAHNGVSFTSQGKNLTFQEYKDGGAFSADNSKIVANRCQFLANNLLSNNNNGNYLPSSIVMLNGSLCGGSVFTNCLWAGNQVSKCNTDSYGIPNNAGMLSITTSAAVDPVDIVNCTYYCNLVDAQNSPVSINVFAGKLNAVNSIFYGAVTGIYQNVAKQIYVHNGAFADISNCLIEEEEDVGCEDGGTIEMNACLFNQDPNFVGTELWNCLNRRISVSNYSNTDARKKTYINSDNFAIYDMTNLNVHVKSSSGYYDENTGKLMTFGRESSPAIDAGKPGYDYSLEPQPNGRRVNLGFYGNTPWAAMSDRRGMKIIIR